MGLVTKIKRKLGLSNPAKEICNRHYEKVNRFSFAGNKCIDEKQYGAVITRWYHTIEKGLAYVNYRAGFGKKNIDALLQSMENYVADGNDKGAFFFQTALSTLNAYIEKNRQYGVENKELEQRVNKLGGSGNTRGGVFAFTPLSSDEIEKLNYKEFVLDRHSMRHFSSDPVEISRVKSAIELAQHTPSACNRQGWRCIIISDRETVTNVLKNQNGKGSDYTTQQMELLDRQIAELEEQYQIQVSKQVEALRNAVEDAGEESPDLGAAKIYADLAEEIKQKIDHCTEERSQLEDERGITVRMKKNYDLFVGCLLALPEENEAGWKLNVNGRDVDGSLFTEADGTPRERKLGLYNQGRLKMDAEKMMQAPDFLKFDKGMYSAFFPKAVVKGDVIEFTTNFGVKLVCRGVDRSLRGFYGFRRIREDGSVEIMTEHWQVADSSINYKRKKRKIVKNADDVADESPADEIEADAVEAV